MKKFVIVFLCVGVFALTAVPIQISAYDFDDEYATAEYNAMDNLKEFKAFLKTIPSIKEDVLNHRYTWQEIYEIYTMYGEDDHFFKPYKEHPIENMNVLEIIKNVDLEALSSSLQSIEKVLGIVSNLLDKNKEGK